ncbi:MAG: TatD family hydrolase [Thermoanaerobacteraceae bacterium]|nr:TatD family hydrolase [Thermoanaerobacteraceae bacterium]
MIVDSHAHYDDEQFDTDRDEVLKRIKQQGVIRVVNPASNLDSARKCIELSTIYDFLYCAVGIHPHDSKQFSKETMLSIRELASFKKVVAIGEIGLDYHYDFSPQDIQKKCFAAHIQLALDLKLPLIIHNREAHKDTLDIIKSEKGYAVSGVFHCFSGSIELAKEVLDMGFYISLGGAVTFKNAKKTVEVAKYVPIDRLLVETDSPYMAPVPYRGKRNDSGYLHEIIKKISEIRNTDFDVIAEATVQNANRLFGLGL